MASDASSTPAVPQRVVLVGPIQQENLALQYLAAAARAAGHEAMVVSYGDRAELDQAVKEVVDRAPDLVGLGMAFQNNIDDYLALMRALRPAGFRGHMTCGGHVPTFCYEELLRDVPDLDTAVRHEAEQTLVEMLDALAQGSAPRNISGLVWREGDRVVAGPVRRPIVDLDSLAPPTRSAEPYVVGGLTVDFLITARGCVGECHYCSIAAFTSEIGIPFRLRKPEPVADEIAAVYHERGARVMFVQDDLFVLPSEKKTVERVERMKARLDERGASDVVFWVKGRPETITPKVCEALARMGTIHMFLGVENASAKRLDYLGRTHLPIHNESAIARCEAAGITPSFNFMLFDPDCSMDDIDATIEMASHHLDLPWNVCRTEVYSGTELRARLEAEGRLEGDYRSYGYRMRDARAELMFRVLRVSFHERALALEALLNRLISLSFARQLHERYFPGRTTDVLSAEVRALTRAVRADTVEELRLAHAFASQCALGDKRGARQFAVDRGLAIGERDLAWRARADDLWQRLNARGVTLMARRGVKPPGRVRTGFGVASGS
ncbi:MAG: radical SAM protein [Polyangiaceae bacterium]|nr:radical SAM protein [Polyangiaceae bacterium]